MINLKIVGLLGVMWVLKEFQNIVGVNGSSSQLEFSLCRQSKESGAQVAKLSSVLFSKILVVVAIAQKVNRVRSQILITQKLIRRIGNILPPSIAGLLALATPLSYNSL